MGVVSWLSAILLKVIMDIYLTPSLGSAIQGSGALASAVALGVYVGLRTGIFENGFTFIWARRTQLWDATFNDAVGFGLGFAGVEALGLGISSFFNFLVLVTNPSLLGTLDPATQKALSDQFALGAALVGPPLIERAMTLFIHVFAVVLVVMTLKDGKTPFILAVLYSSVTDGIIPILSLYVSSTTLAGIYLIETPFVFLGLAGLFGLLRVRDNPAFAVSRPSQGIPHALEALSPKHPEEHLPELGF